MSIPERNASYVRMAPVTFLCRLDRYTVDSEGLNYLAFLCSMYYLSRFE
jgi:hypothetical protein